MYGKAGTVHLFKRKKAGTVLNVLEHMIQDESAKPTKLPLPLLEDITNNFSNEQEISRGGFAVVYKGILGNGSVAVKKLYTTLDIDERKFNQEVQCLLKVRHTNIVRFLGYCADTQGEATDYEGKFVMADVRTRLLCFAFIPNGSLHDYITDASRGLEWRVCYQMIKGICTGLHYLHENHIVHLDLKPSNILLDHNMVPKIADFGLSRCFDENQSKAITSKLIGSLGYLAPEFYGGQITFKLDIYSLGVIILEILTGSKGYFPVEKILESWRNRLEISQKDTALKQVRACAEIGLMCIDSNPENRPITQRIIKTFKELGTTSKFVEASSSSKANGVSRCSDALAAAGSQLANGAVHFFRLGCGVWHCSASASEAEAEGSCAPRSRRRRSFVVVADSGLAGASSQRTAAKLAPRLPWWWCTPQGTAKKMWQFMVKIRQVSGKFFITLVHWHQASSTWRRRRSPRRLDRCKAAKRVDYEVGARASASVGASWSPSSSAEQQRSSGSGLRPSRSLPLDISFRIVGSAEGEVDELCRTLGISGPEEFAIPLAAWEARRSWRPISELLLRRPRLDSSLPAEELSTIARAVSAPNVQPTLSVPAVPPVGGLPFPSPRIRAAQPPLLSPPPPITALAPPPVRWPVVAVDTTVSVWDIVRSFAPSED